MIPKFKVWHKELKMMFEVKSLGFTLNLATITSKNDLFPSRTCSFDDIFLMQSTGLFDVNGKEIFESDIVKTTIFFGRADESGGFYEYEKELIGIVKQLEGAWVIDTEKGAVYLWSDIDENEVLGNIWDNLELLEDLE